MKKIFLLGFIVVWAWVGIVPTSAQEISITTCDFASLRDAISGNSTRMERMITLNCTGTIVFESSIIITIRISIVASDGVIFDGGGENAFFEVHSAGDLTLDGITLQHGIGEYGVIENDGLLTVNNSIFRNNEGGFSTSIYNSGTLMVDNTKFIGNREGVGGESTLGGAIVNYIEGRATITRSSFIENSATTGAAILNQGEMTITASDFFDNVAVGAGGVIGNWVGAMLTVTNSTFSGNDAAYGGVFYNGTATLIIRQSTFTSNTAQEFGGVLFGEFDGTISIQNSVFRQNSASFGGVFGLRAGTLTIDASTFYQNSATRQGGVVWNNGDVSITNSTFVENTADDLGGAIYSIGGDASVAVDHSTFVDNTDVGGAGTIYIYGTFTMTHSLITAPAERGQCLGMSDINADETNLVMSACGDARIVDDLRLGEFDGIVVPLLADSPALDAYLVPCSIATDQTGNTRPQADACDLGAVEMPME